MFLSPPPSPSKCVQQKQSTENFPVCIHNETKLKNISMKDLGVIPKMFSLR